MAKHDSILKCKVFWTLGGVGLFLAVVCAAIINYQLSKSPLYSTCEAFFLPHCLENLVSNMRVPIGILTVTLTLLGFWALIFRSGQTARQIELTSNQIELTINHNTFTNFLAHKKAFMELLGGLEEEYEVRFSNKENLYRKLFPRNAPNNVDFTGHEEGVIFLIGRYNELEEEFREIRGIIKDNIINGVLQLAECAPKILSGLKWLNCELIENSPFRFKTPLELADMEVMVTKNVEGPQDIYSALATYRALIVGLKEFTHTQGAHEINNVTKCKETENTYERLLSTERKI